MNSRMPAPDAHSRMPHTHTRCAVQARHPDPICKTSGLAAILLSRPDVPAAARWLEDFGLVPLTIATDFALLRGAGSRTACVVIRRGPARYEGMSLFIDNAGNFEKLARHTGAQIEASDATIGGHRLRLTDPDGITVEAVHGTHDLAPLPLPSRIAANPANADVDALPRINGTVRFAEKNPSIATLGHTVLGVRNFVKTAHWYQQHFGFIVSDFQLLPGDPVPAVAFMRCDRGDLPTDHHTLALSSAVDVGHLHTAFEMDDFDAVGRASDFLRARRYRHTWGIGRHILGSQVFDYWRDPSGDMFEHYADSDRFDASVRTGYHAFGGDTLHQWGPKPGADMVGKIPTPQRAKTLLSRLRDREDDLTAARLMRLMRASA